MVYYCLSYSCFMGLQIILCASLALYGAYWLLNNVMILFHASFIVTTEILSVVYLSDGNRREWVIQRRIITVRYLMYAAFLVAFSFRQPYNTEIRNANQRISASKKNIFFITVLDFIYRNRTKYSCVKCKHSSNWAINAAYRQIDRRTYRKINSGGGL